MSEENIEKKINYLLKELKNMTGVSDEEIEEFKKIMNLEDYSPDKD